MEIPVLVENIVKSLVDAPESVLIEEKAGHRTSVINISTAREDIGKIIGKSGKVITALRVLIENIASKNGKRVSY